MALRVALDGIEPLYANLLKKKTFVQVISKNQAFLSNPIIFCIKRNSKGKMARSGLVVTDWNRVNLISVKKLKFKGKKFNADSLPLWFLQSLNISKRTDFRTQSHGKDITPVSGSEMYQLRLLRVSHNKSLD